MDLQPHQFGEVFANDKGVHGMPLPEAADHYYRTEPAYMRALEDDVRKHGFQEPVHVEMRNHPTSLLKPKQAWLVQGQHRAAVGHRLGIPVPAFGNHPDDFRPMVESMRDPANVARTALWHDRRRQVPEEEIARRKTTGSLP